jgi:hypothetical protein
MDYKNGPYCNVFDYLIGTYDILHNFVDNDKFKQNKLNKKIKLKN